MLVSEENKLLSVNSLSIYVIDSPSFNMIINSKD